MSSSVEQLPESKINTSPNGRTRFRLSFRRFSLRTMLIVVTVIALLLGLWIMPSLRQYWAVQQIEASGGRVYSGKNEVAKIDHWSWHFFHNVTLVDAKLRADTDIEWRSLPKLKGCAISYLTYVQSGPRKLSDDIIKEQRAVFPKKIIEILRNQLTPNLEGLEIIAQQDEDVTDETMSHLVRFPHLNTFSANLSRITDKGFQNLARLKKLKFLRIGRGHADNDPINLNIMNEWPDLEYFSLRLIKGNVAWDQIRFREFTKLKEFEITFSGFSNDAVMKISELPAVEKLWLEFGDKELADQSIDEGISAVAKMAKLNQLSIEGNAKVSAVGFKAIAHSTTISKLWLSCRFNPVDLEHLASMPQLRELNFGRFGNSPINDQFVQHLTNFKNLKKLNIRDASITDTGLETLTALENLEELNISGTKITAGGITSLKKFKNLKSLRITQSSLWHSISGMAQLMKELPNVDISN